ncbi:TetR/AcrR family transcriptional regulator [Streptomyces mexicanus]|uniref:TetR/AcrR family transcriptional regulator n=1 Tax=Streptomyces mexicanus TaxID=178566 RepID=A0A7X1HY43_9ACTN|nr:TetR/AcrR family transcriptional regulator [Streptomyces mexicanus]MBC2865169.1 TetR/AcrR family transcriptional regulator [Streptomyces mexicanus]
MNTSPPESKAQPLGRRERNKIKIKERLYTAALELFAEHGYEQTSVDEIAERADVARGTFFNHFQRKEDLISTWGERRRERLVAVMADALPDEAGAAERLRRCMTILGRINEEEHESAAAMLIAWVKAGRPLMEEPYVAELFAEIIEDGRKNGELRQDIRPRQVGNVLRDIYLGTLYRWFRDVEVELDGKLEQELLEATELLLNGIVARP